MLIDHFYFILFLLVGNFSEHSLRVPASSILSSDFPRCDFPSACSAQWVSELCLKATLPRTCSNVYIGLFVFEEKWDKCMQEWLGAEGLYISSVKTSRDFLQNNKRSHYQSGGHSLWSYSYTWQHWNGTNWSVYVCATWLGNNYFINELPHRTNNRHTISYHNEKFYESFIFKTLTWSSALWVLAQTEYLSEFPGFHA